MSLHIKKLTNMSLNQSSRADGLFAGVYTKTRWGKEINQENISEFHR